MYNAPEWIVDASPWNWNTDENGAVPLAGGDGRRAAPALLFRLGPLVRQSMFGLLVAH